MNEPKKWGYIYDEKLNMYVPNLPRQKKFAKVLLILALISFANSFPSINIVFHLFLKTFHLSSLHLTSVSYFLV